jgi:hypothetical protein
MPRIILPLDGGETHLNEAKTHIIDGWLAKAHDIEIVKLEASTSKIQQPPDVAPC